MPDPVCFKTAPPLEGSIERFPRGGFTKVIEILELWAKYRDGGKIFNFQWDKNKSFLLETLQGGINTIVLPDWLKHSQDTRRHTSSRVKRKWLSHRRKTKDWIWIKTFTEDDTLKKKKKSLVFMRNYFQSSGWRVKVLRLMALVFCSLDEVPV